MSDENSIVIGVFSDSWYTKHSKRNAGNELVVLIGVAVMESKKMMDSKGKKIICELCDKSFASIATLKQYLRTHNVNRIKHVCKYCKKKFTRKSTLSRHVQYEHDPDIIPFKCSFCDYTDKYKHNVSSHIKRMHQNGLDKTQSENVVQQQQQQQNVGPPLQQEEMPRKLNVRILLICKPLSKSEQAEAKLEQAVGQNLRLSSAAALQAKKLVPNHHPLVINKVETTVQRMILLKSGPIDKLTSEQLPAVVDQPVLPIGEINVTEAKVKQKLLENSATPTTPIISEASSNSAGPNGNNNNSSSSAAGEDSGIEFMDALSEKSPKQGESPLHRPAAAEDPVVSASSVKSSSNNTPTTAIPTRAVPFATSGTSSNSFGESSRNGGAEPNTAEPEFTSSSKPRQYLINPLTGLLEPMPSDTSDSEPESALEMPDDFLDFPSPSNDRSNSESAVIVAAEQPRRSEQDLECQQDLTMNDEPTITETSMPTASKLVADLKASLEEKDELLSELRAKLKATEEELQATLQKEEAEQAGQQQQQQQKDLEDDVVEIFENDPEIEIVGWTFNKSKTADAAAASGQPRLSGSRAPQKNNKKLPAAVTTIAPTAATTTAPDTKTAAPNSDHSRNMLENSQARCKRTCEEDEESSSQRHRKSESERQSRLGHDNYSLDGHHKKYDYVSFLDGRNEPAVPGGFKGKNKSILEGFCYEILRKGICKDGDQCTYPDHDLEHFIARINLQSYDTIKSIADFAVQNNFRFLLSQIPSKKRQNESQL